MSTVKADTVQPKDFASDLTLGASGDTVTVTADSINVNKVQDKGGNTLWDYSTGEFVSGDPIFGSANLKLLITATTSATSSVSFTTEIDSTYDVYIFKFYNINPETADAWLGFQMSSDDTNFDEPVTSTAFRAAHFEADDFANLSYQTGSDLAQATTYQPITEVSGIGNGSDDSAVGTLHVFNPSSTTYVKQWYARMNVSYAGSGNASPNDHFSAGYFNTTDALTAVSFKMNSGNFDGTVKMYGLL